MKNWMIELEKRIGPESTKITVHAIAGTVTFATILIGNWHMLV